MLKDVYLKALLNLIILGWNSGTGEKVKVPRKMYCIDKNILIQSINDCSHAVEDNQTNLLIYV